MKVEYATIGSSALCTVAPIVAYSPFICLLAICYKWWDGQLILDAEYTWNGNDQVRQQDDGKVDRHVELIRHWHGVLAGLLKVRNAAQKDHRLAHVSDGIECDPHGIA